MNIFVSPSGDDVKGDGTQRRPFLTIERAMELAQPADTIRPIGTGELRQTIKAHLTVTDPTKVPTSASDDSKAESRKSL